MPIILLLLLGIIWGSGYSIARFAMLHGVNALGYTFWQCLGPAIILGLLSLKKLKFTKAHIQFYFFCGISGIAIPNTTMYFASAHLPAGLLALIVNIVPIIIYPLALLAKQEKFDGLRLVGVSLAIAGVLVLIAPTVALPQPQEMHWLLLALITPACFAFFAVFLNPQRPENSDPLSLAAGMLIAATLLLAPWMLHSHEFYAIHWPMNLPDKIIMLEIILSSVGYVVFFQLLKIAGPVYYSLVDGIVAITGLIWGKIIFSETFSIQIFIAVALILIGILFVNRHVIVSKH